MTRTLKSRMIQLTARARLWTRRHVRPGFRLPLGVLLVVFGLFGFLPILGFWMIPLGIALMALDVRMYRGAIADRRKNRMPADEARREEDGTGRQKR